MLDVNLFWLVAREGEVEAVQSSLFLVIQQFSAIKEIGLAVLFAEEKPVPAGGAVQRALFEEGTEGSKAGTGTAHYDVAREIFGQTKRAGLLDVNGDVL